MHSAPRLTIVIPTRCDLSRRDSLWRAVASAHASATEPVLVLIVANGAKVDEQLYAALGGKEGVACMRLERGSAPEAVLAGRRAVSTAFFGFLDDDDELLPRASDIRLQAFDRDPALDVALTNGYRESLGQRELRFSVMPAVDATPLSTLLELNWLASCAALYRSRTVGVKPFESPPPFAAWTWLGFRLCLDERRFWATDMPGYVIHDTPNSLSKSDPDRYIRNYVAIFDRMLAAAPPGWARRRILQKRCAALHDLSVRALEAGCVRSALSWHLKCLRSPWGWKYLPYSRKLITAPARRAGPS